MGQLVNEVIDMNIKLVARQQYTRVVKFPYLVMYACCPHLQAKLLCVKV